jgi:hypothetical protein
LPGSSPAFIGLPHHTIGSTYRFYPRTRFSTGRLSGLQLFLNVQASQFARLPDRSYRCKLPHRAAEASTSEQNVRRCLRTHRTCYPPDYRQLAERGLSPRKTRSLVGCSRMMPTFPSPPLKFRTAGFPRYGFKAGISDVAFPANWFAIVLRALCCHPVFPARCQGGCALSTSVRADLPLYPRGPRSGPGYAVPVHPRLSGPIRPTRGHISISPSRGLYQMPSLCRFASA